jgi:hypothetical protein
MTKLNFNSTQNVNDAAGRIRFCKSGTAVIAGLLISSLLTVGCSQETSKPAGSGSPTPASQTSMNQAAPVPSSMPSPVTSQTPAPKKVVKKRPTTVAYNDPTYGVSFRYPRKYALKSGSDVNADANSAAMNFVQPGGVTTVAVELPKSSYPGTDLSSAFFRVNVNKSLTAEECGQFSLLQPMPSDKDGVQPSHDLGGMTLQEVKDITTVKQADTKYYHVFQNGACYEFALGLSTQGDVSEDGVKPVDREDVFRRLEKILASVKIKPEAAPEVAAGTAAVPAAQDGVVK